MAPQLEEPTRPCRWSACVCPAVGDGSVRDKVSEQAAVELTQNLEYWPPAIELACGYLVSCTLGPAEVSR